MWKPTFNVLLLFLICINAKRSYYGDQVWKLIPTTNEQVEYLKILQNSPGFDIDAWTESVAVNQYSLYHVPKQSLYSLRNHLKYHNIEPIVTIQNLEKVITQQSPYARSSTIKATSIGDFNYTVYHTVNEVPPCLYFPYVQTDIRMDRFCSYSSKRGKVSNRNHVRRQTNIRIKIGTNNGSKPIIYLDALIHCREWITTATTIYTFKEILTNPDYKFMTDNVDWVFIPMINIDGFEYTHSSDRLWRKTRSQSASIECTGVDANRNWNDHWSGAGTEKRPCSIFYHGPAAESESEVRHLARYITANKEKITAVISVHSFSQLILYPYNFRVNSSDIVPNHEELQTLGDEMATAIFNTHGKIYIVGPGAETIYPCSGITTDWTYGQAGINISYSFELRDTGEYGQVLPPDQILPNGQEFLAAVIKLVEHVTYEFSGEGSG